MLLCAAFLTLVDPRIVGDWTLTFRGSVANSRLHFGNDRRFVLSTPVQTKPMPPIVGPYEIVRTTSGELLVRCLYKETLAFSGIPRQPWQGKVTKLELRFVPEVPALIVDREEAYLLLRDLLVAQRRLAAWRATPHRP